MAAVVFFIWGAGSGAEPGIGREVSGLSDQAAGSASQEPLDPGIRERMTAEQKKIADMAARQPQAPDNTIAKINSALELGDLSEFEAVKLRLAALTEPDKLPGEYKGESPKGHSSLTSDTKWVLQNWESFNEEQKSDLLPYILPPDEEGSVFYPEAEVSSLFIPAAKAAEYKLYSRKIESPGKAKIYYFIESSLSEAEKNKVRDKATAVEDALDDAWPEFSNLLDIDLSERVYIYLLDMKDYGSAQMYEKDGARRCLIKLKQSEDDETLKASLAHELFHCFQFRLNSKYEESTNDINWLGEATAVWSEDYIYSTYNTEHLYLKDGFFPLLYDEFMYADDYREYGHYVWFFFVTDHYPDADEAYVKQVLEARANGSIRHSLQTGLADYDEAYRQFSYYNWNTRPFFNYEDDPPFPEMFPQGFTLKYENRFEKGTQEYPVKLKPGSMQYYAFAFDESESGAHFAKVRIKEHADNVSVTSMFKQDMNPHTEDWSEPEEREFCVTDNDTELLILALANSDQSESANLVFDVEMVSECPSVSHGYVHIEEKTENLMGGSSIVMHSEEILEYDEEEDAYDIVERTVTCETNSVGEQPAMYGAPAYRVETTGSGSLSESYHDTEDRPWRIYMRGGIEDTLNIAPETKDKGWVSETTTTTGSPSTTENTTCSGAIWPADYTLKPDQITEDGIKGSDVIEVTNPGATMTFEVEFEYQYK